VNFLLANLLWILINMAWIFDRLGSSYNHQIITDVFDADGFGGLDHLRSLILKSGLFYFSCLSLALISYSSPLNNMFLVCYENLLYLLMMIIGAAFFFTSIRSLKRILRVKVDDQIDKLNGSYQNQHAQLVVLASLEGGIAANDEILRVSSILDALHRERERIINAYGFDHEFNIVAVISPIISIALKVLADLLLR
jgi:hypothetical protein